MTPSHRARAIDLVAPHCDLVERLELVPPSAAVRGVYLGNIQQHLERAGRLGAFREYFPDDHFTSLRYYPLGDYLIRIACAGAVVAGPERVHQGMFQISLDNAATAAGSLLGRAMFRLLARDPGRLVEQGLAFRRQTNRYGLWTLLKHAPGFVEMVYEDEYTWIESIIDGSAKGTFQDCGFEVSVETELRSRFSGSTRIRWGEGARDRSR
jgi:hypothetical protein